MKVKRLIEMLEEYEDYDVSFGIYTRCEKSGFPYVEKIDEIVIDDVCYSENHISLGHDDKKIFKLLEE